MRRDDQTADGELTTLADAELERVWGGLSSVEEIIQRAAVGLKLQREIDDLKAQLEAQKQAQPVTNITVNNTVIVEQPSAPRRGRNAGR